jgi:hypothetical protein
MSTYAPPPRPARLVNELPTLVNERPAPVVAPRTVTIRWDSALTAISTFAIGLVLGVTVATSVMSAAAVVNEDHAVVNEDPYSGVPACTDRIADAGGICHGEPLPLRADDGQRSRPRRGDPVTRPGEPSVAELQRRLDLMAASGINTGALLDNNVRQGLMSERVGNQLTGSYRVSS